MHSQSAVHPQGENIAVMDQDTSAQFKSDFAKTLISQSEECFSIFVDREGSGINCEDGEDHSESGISDDFDSLCYLFHLKSSELKNLQMQLEYTVLNSQNKGLKDQSKGLSLNNDFMNNERLEKEAFDLRSKLNRIENSKQVYEMVTEKVLIFFNEINSSITQTDVRNNVESFTLPKMKHGPSERKQNLNQEVLKYKFERQILKQNTKAMVVQKS